MNTIEDIIDRLIDILEKERGEKVYVKDVAKALKMSSSQLSNFKSRKSIPYDKITEYCARNRININWVLFGQSVEMLNSEVESVYRVKLIEGVHSSAGGGAFNDEDVEFSYLTIDPIYKDLLGINNIDEIEAIRVIGDSMEDTLHEGAIILVNRKKTELSNGGIFVINTPGGVFVKRVAINPTGGVDLISDNKSYETQTIPFEDVTVVGRVIGALEKI
ncbi:LexA family transcriptional regulator [Sulfurovum sp. ST-21]|uniref:LexA family transcriptional regulator n=1 Tax=Sulfurovum indicum TaxID=2779528 RepID=A0A7M1S497_9BACT|nr:LexA family transcriptional regulator [Sulfurovum indicum]QOR61171.1 LexA family transcriptional regulator [Sulfurovum indicum]QOR61902.1 LexA family transcriptional regulator [Sulfurovum indicum]